MKYKKFLFLSLILTFLLGLNACTPAVTQSTKQEKHDKKTLYASFFPVADLAKHIVKDKWTIKTIIQTGEEPHSFELKIKDMQELTQADLIVYNGANMEAFIPDLKKALQKEDHFLDLSQGLTLLYSGTHQKAEQVNPHTWLSIKNALIQLDTLYEKISSLDPENDSFYKENLEEAKKSFSALDKTFEEELSKITKKEKFFVVSHAAFNYLAEDYALKQVAVTGISPEDEPSAKQLKEIADFVKKHQISTIFFEGKATPKVAETLAKNTNTKTGILYTMESLTQEEAALGYLELMKRNLEALVESFQ